MVNSSELAEYISGYHIGCDVNITGFNSLDKAESSDLSFCVYDDESLVRNSSAGAIIVPNSFSKIEDMTLIRCTEPRIGFIKSVREFFVEKTDETKIHPSAIVEEGAEIGDGCEIGSNVYIHESVKIGNNCKIMPSTCLGLESFGFTRDNNGDLWNHVFKGDVVIEDNVWIGACTAVDRGMFDTTKIQEGTKIQNLVHVGHETNIGESTLINQMTSLAGNVNIGNKVRIHPAVSVAGYVEIGDRSEVGTNSTVLENVPMNTKVAGVPAKKIGEVSLQTTTFDVDAKNKMGDEE